MASPWSWVWASRVVVTSATCRRLSSDAMDTASFGMGIAAVRSWGRGSRLWDPHPVGVQRHAVGLGSIADAGVERVDRGELLTGEIEVEDVEVLRDATGVGRTSGRVPVRVQVLPEHHLGRRPAVLARDLVQRRVVERGLVGPAVGGDPTDRGPRLGDAAVLRCARPAARSAGSTDGPRFGDRLGGLPRRGLEDQTPSAGDQYRNRLETIFK